MLPTDVDKSDKSDLRPREIVPFLIRAARVLTPVFLKYGVLESRYRSFVDSVQGTGNKRRLILSPIAANAIPTRVDSRIQVYSLDPELRWKLSVPGVERVDDYSVAIGLENARLIRGESASENTMQLANDPLVLATLAGIDEKKSNIFLISEIGSIECVIETTDPFEPETVLPYVEIVGDKRVLRTASATVVGVDPWFMPDGSQRYRCHLKLTHPAVKDSTDVFDTVKEVARVHRTVDLAGMLTAFGWCEVAGRGQSTVRFIRVERDSALLELCSTHVPKLQKRTTVRIGVEIFAVYYEMDVRILEVTNERIRVTLPLVLKRRRQHRRAERVRVPEQYDLCVRFYNPTTGLFRKRLVKDISYVGLTFSYNEQDPLWEGLILESTELIWKGERISVGDLEVCSLNMRDDLHLCHTSINSAGAANNPILVKLIATLSHPDIRFHTGKGNSSLIDIYLKGGLFAPHMHRNLEPILDEAMAVWTKLHSGDADVVRTLVQGPIDSPNIAMTSIRGWERAWMAQHFVSVNPKFDRAIGKLQLAQLDHVLPRSDGHYILFFVKADNKLMNSFLQNFFSTTGTTDSVTIITVELWYRTGATRNLFPNRKPDIKVRPMRRNEQKLVSRAAQRSLGILPAKALAMLPGELTLPESYKSFQKAGLHRERICRIATCRRQPVYAVLEERSSPGLNLTWMLNANWILPIHANLDPNGHVLLSVLQSIVEAPAQSPSGDRFLNLTQRMPKKAFSDAGFELIAPVNLYVLNRAGLQRYYYYAASRYGEMSALVQRRNARKKSLDISTTSDQRASR